eukprot:2055409-Pyramimonas_sp.AAC.1
MKADKCTQPASLTVGEPWGLGSWVESLTRGGYSRRCVNSQAGGADLQQEVRIHRQRGASSSGNA